jgi:hypothetical protein
VLKSVALDIRSAVADRTSQQVTSQSIGRDSGVG